MLNRWAHVCCAYRGSILSFHRSAGLLGRVPSPSAGPPRREGPGRSIVPVWRPAAWAPHPGARLPAAWRALIRRCRPLLPYRRGPPYQCLPMRRLVSGTACFPAAAVPHPYSCFRSVSVAPWRGCRRYRLFLPYRPAPPDQCLGVPCSVPGAVHSSPTAPTRPISAFVRSPFGGRWPSRIPIIAQSKFAQCSESCEVVPACVVPRRNL